MINSTREPDGSAGGEGFDLVGAQMLAGFPQLCATLGATPEDLLSAVGIPCGTQRPARVTYRQFVDLLASASNRLGCLDFGMRLAIHQAGTDLYGPLGTIMRSARTFGEALQYVVELAHVHSPAARITRHAIPGREGIVFSHEIIVGDFAQQEQAMEHILLAGHLGAMVLTSGRSRGRQILLRHRPVSSPAVYRRNFGCEVLFDQPVDGIVFSKQDLANTIVGQDRSVASKAIANVLAHWPVQAPPIEAATRAAILRLIPVGLATNTHVAAELGMNTRALHRRLRESGTTFQKIKDQVRCELVRYYVRHTELSFLWITGKLDFAEQAVFTRFCRRHLGVSPTELRAQAAGR
ncbi:AraC family transcriptional regulator [Novosphingobium sp. M1R2S20]|uniref:AraC family transcriptional regulator ligand-binding domain-containing protein n=1 Tax=Novosphingobium rhizovicinum TaxID=3228928 RepID=A0ABV3RE12_9SPHN